MSQRIKEFGAPFWLHLFTIGVTYSSPFVFSWKLIALGIFAYYIQLLILGACFLSIWQFHSRRTAFYSHYLSRLGFSVNPKKVDMVVDYIIPFVVLSTALVWQISLGHATVF